MAAAPTLVLVLSIVVALFGGVARGEAGYQIESADYPTTLASGHESSERDVFKLAFQRAHVKDGFVVVRFTEFDLPNPSASCSADTGAFVYFDTVDRSHHDDACTRQYDLAGDTMRVGHFCNANKPSESMVVIDLRARPGHERGLRRLNIGLCRGATSEPVVGRGFQAHVELWSRQHDAVEMESFHGSVVEFP